MIRKKIDLPRPFTVVFILFWLLVASHNLGLWNYLRPAGEWKTITNDLYHFSVDYPTKWSAHTYGEYGDRGASEIKLRIYGSLYSDFKISIEQMSAETPTLDDVVEWGERRIIHLNIGERRSRYIYRELSSRIDFVDGNKVIVRRYGNVERTFEEVYIARPDDMLMIRLQVDTEDLDQYLDDYYRIVDSFHTIE
ncbi:MAG: hypothetical protein WAM60_13140 [Candidatus Promineifilaceae bacterium]